MGDAEQDLAILRRRLLKARENRQTVLDRLRGAGGTTVFVTAGLPGPDKWRPGLAALQQLAERALTSALPAVALGRGRDALGPWAAYRVRVPAEAAKRTAIDIEASLPAGRLLDLDVYDGGGRQVDRVALGLPARPCLLCARPAVECIRRGSHASIEISAAAHRLLPGVLARLLVDGARSELALTPKPGLVDRLDCGSHPDLSFEAMSRSIDLLPQYFDELLEHAVPLDLHASVEAGRRAERRMMERVGANTHKGYIFLAGLVLLAAGSADGRTDLPAVVADLAGRILGPPPNGVPSSASHGARIRAEHGVGGIHREALLGLPSVFDRGLPALRGKDPGALATQHRLMAVLMQAVEDTTALHRCGPAGLARLEADGERLERLIDGGRDYLPWLAGLNDAYRRMNLTMGGVADCMALSFALHDWLDRPADRPDGEADDL